MFSVFMATPGKKLVFYWITILWRILPLICTLLKSIIHILFIYNTDTSPGCHVPAKTNDWVYTGAYPVLNKP